MLANKSILAVVPARGGSKGVPRKNLRLLKGKPLIQYTIEVIKECHWIDHALVSTDDEEISKVAISLGMNVPFLRPLELAQDFVPDMPVLKHALEFEEKRLNKEFDVVLMLQPTCPLRVPSNMLECALLLLEGDYEAVWTVSQADLKYHPDKQLKISDSGHITFFTEKGGQIVARQQLSPTFYRNGNTYAFTRNSVLNSASTLSSKTGALLLKDDQVNIDSIEDFEKAERILQSLTPNA